MDKFKIKEHIYFVIDTIGVSILDKENHQSNFLTYPEAGIWLILSAGTNLPKSLKMLEPILGKNAEETKKCVNQCLDNWRNKGYIY
jgi:hypothetical protein